MTRKRKLKKKWASPLLTVVVREKPEERVLGSCKAFVVSGSGPQNTGGLCAIQPWPACNPCAQSTFS